MLKTFIILGPNGDNGLPMHWNKRGEWVECGKPTVETLYSEREVFGFPPWELPVGGTGIMDMAQDILWIPKTPLDKQ